MNHISFQKYILEIEKLIPLTKTDINYLYEYYLHILHNNENLKLCYLIKKVWQDETIYQIYYDKDTLISQLNVTKKDKDITKIKILYYNNLDNLKTIQYFLNEVIAIEIDFKPNNIAILDKKVIPTNKLEIPLIVFKEIKTAYKNNTLLLEEYYYNGEPYSKKYRMNDEEYSIMYQNEQIKVLEEKESLESFWQHYNQVSQKVRERLL